MAVSVEKQNNIDTGDMFRSYPKYQNHIYDTRKAKECVVSMIDIDGSEYETDGKTYLSRKKQMAGYKVTLHFSKSQNDIGSVVQRILGDEFIRELKQK